MIAKAKAKAKAEVEVRARYAEVLSAMTDDREEIIITRAGHEPVVIVVPLRRPPHSQADCWHCR
ncbi:Antitoxin of toxin-antitoxin stability system N-terminal [Frankia torreyi]|uniref:Antitoxin of toxin-antitoxin stability system N-terminal n=1 Tax=Frankia torreyi TaxID=1856 RepID=A0A0D8BDH2_9ACTN|nr:Antitoxin of toxin-antitoxin stability system N-terminal [Frankia torreyi]KQM04371.1 Antitoxin of toxin-antitoxin stability system N-terminal [Frankia sp. CpI1-P]